MSGLEVATLIVYIILIQPITYCLWRHGRPGILGWLCIQSFCVVRIVGSAMLLHAEAAHSTSNSALLLSSIGLSPLLIGTVGILHEARLARNPGLRRKLEWFFVLNYHAIVSTALVLVIIGIVNIMNGKEGSSNIVLKKIGSVVLLLCWVVLVVWVWLSMGSQQKANGPAYVDGTKLLYAVATTLPFLGCREIYAVCSVFITSPGFTSSLTVKIALSVVPEMVVTATLAKAGVDTRKISKALKGRAAFSGDYMATPLGGDPS